jgi:two-component system, NarL family, nitrate/nitrite response regulator NarL
MEAAIHPRSRPVQVLLVDDEQPFLDMVQALLASDDRIEVVGTARNGLEAVELAVELEPDVTLMDISMPIVDGIEATRRIRERRPHATILMVTGSSEASDVDRSRQAGAAGYLTKDRVGSQLVEKVLAAVR